MIRVLHVVGALNPGGVETWLMNALRFMSGSTFDFHFCAFAEQRGAYEDEVERLGGRIVRCQIDGSLLRLFGKLRYAIGDGEYQVVHSHNHLFSGIVLRAAKAEGVPIRIAHSHTTRDGKSSTIPRKLYRALMQRWVQKYSTHGLAASAEAAQSLFGKSWAQDPRFRVLHCGIDLNPFENPANSGEVRAELGLPQGVPVIGHVGRFVEPKNHGFLLDIARKVLAIRPDCHFLLVGDGPLRSAVETRARNLGIAERVSFTGYRGDVPRLMCAAMDVLLFPSTWEGLPVALLEAQASGLRCLVSDVVTREVIVVRECLEFCSLSASSSEWAGRLLNLLSLAPVDRTSLLKAVKESDFNIESGCAILRSLYEGALHSDKSKLKF